MKLVWVIYRRKGVKHKSERLAKSVDGTNDICEIATKMSEFYDIIDICESVNMGKI